MKKAFLIIIAILGMASAKAQIKDSGLRVIGEIGLGIGTISDEGFGTINPSIECSFGANVMSQIFLGGGIGYDTQIGISDAEGTYHEAKIFAHGRYYFSSNNAIIDLKLGYKRDFSNDTDACEVFVGPGYMFCDKYNVSVGYLGSYYDGTSVHGGAIKFGIEF